MRFISMLDSQYLLSGLGQNMGR